MEQVIVQIAIQVPALALVSFVFLRLFERILDMQGKKLDRLAEALDELRRAK